MNVWAPLANRIGVWSIKSQLEDLSFSCLLPTEHMVLARALRPAQEPTTLVKLMDGLRSALQENDIDHLDLTGRPKHLWGVWCKMQKKGYAADEVQDVRGLRVIVSSREDCYKVLRAVETSWKVVGQTKNYIKDPKRNGYQSLHVIADPGDGHLVEIQIRTDKMHYLAEYGAHASHWKYKEAPDSKKADSKKASTEGSATNWAKFETQKHVGIDQKFRPSGSPTEDKSLERIMAAWKEQTARAKERSGGDGSAAAGVNTNASNASSSTSTTTKSFHQYIEESGQVLAPPDQEDDNARVVVALVRGGTFAVETVSQGTTVADLLSGSTGQDARIIVNRVEVHSRNLSARLKNGDAVEVHYVSTPNITATPVSPASQGNLMPIHGNLPGLTSKLRQVNL
jgi:(p)ppGpp synthase/HD superfamily hydrolase